jgi:hypothetical protein
MATVELDGIACEEDSGDVDSQGHLGIDVEELERILQKLGQKCNNRLLIEEMISKGEYKLPGILRCYCANCLGYKPLGECKGQGYDNPRMQVVNRISEINMLRGERVEF